MAVRFDPLQHRYWHDTRELVSVTTVLRHAGYVSTGAHYQESHRQRGTDVHEATLVVDDHPADWERIVQDDVIGGYAESYAKCLADHIISWELREVVVADLALGVAGIVDASGVLDGYDVTVDFKSGDDDPSYGPQTAGYERMSPRQSMPFRRKRYVLLLQRDGSRAKFIPKTNRADYDAFLAAVHTYYWRKEHGRL